MLPIKRFFLDTYSAVHSAHGNSQTCLLGSGVSNFSPRWASAAFSCDWRAHLLAPPLPGSPGMTSCLFSVSYLYLTWSQMHWFQKREKGLPGWRPCLRARPLKWLMIPRHDSPKIESFSFGLIYTGVLMLILGLRARRRPLFSHESRGLCFMGCLGLVLMH